MDAFDRAKRDIICALIMSQIASATVIILGAKLLRRAGSLF
jgi:hypothetical protein